FACILVVFLMMDRNHVGIEGLFAPSCSRLIEGVEEGDISGIVRIAKNNVVECSTFLPLITQPLVGIAGRQPLQSAARNVGDAVDTMQADGGLQHTFAAQPDNHAPFHLSATRLRAIAIRESLPPAFKIRGVLGWLGNACRLFYELLAALITRIVLEIFVEP